MLSAAGVQPVSPLLPYPLAKSNHTQGKAQDKTVEIA